MIDKILRLQNHFEILGFDIMDKNFDESTMDVWNVWKVAKKLMLRVHPDKNRDVDSQLCNDAVWKITDAKEWVIEKLNW